MTDAATPASPAAPLQGVADRIARVVATLATIALLGLVLVQGWQVIARYLLNDSPSWTEPVTVLLLSTIVGLGAALGVHERRHFSFALLADSLGPAARRVLQGVSQLVITLIGAIIAWWGWVLFMDGLHIPTAGAPLPQGASYLPLAAGGALMALFALHQLFAPLRGNQGKR